MCHLRRGSGDPGERSRRTRLLTVGIGDIEIEWIVRAYHSVHLLRSPQHYACPDVGGMHQPAWGGALSPFRVDFETEICELESQPPFEPMP